MGRRPDPERRAELLGDVVGYLLEHGVHQTSLRPLATELGTSTYTFVYHFGSKEELLAEALEEIATRHAAAVEGLRKGTLDEFILNYWTWNLEADRLRTISVVTDARSLVRTQGELFRPFVRAVTNAVQSSITSRLEAQGRSPAESAVISVALLGALAELATEDTEEFRVEAVQRLVERVA
ncbi:MAG: TetR/AcrR family transcriptional regulator [Acidimicrobiales bacterium]